MGYIVPAICQRRKVGSPTQKAVLMALASYAWDDGTNVWVSKTTLAADLELGRRTIQDAVQALIEKGILTETGTKSAERGYTIEYRINLDVVEALPVTREIRKSAARKACEVRTKESQSVRLTTPKCAADDGKACESRTQVSNKYINKNTRAREVAPEAVQETDAMQTAEARDLSLTKIAERLEGSGYVPPSAISTGLAAELVGRGLVKMETMKRRGIAC